MIVCGALAARAANHVVESSVLGEQELDMTPAAVASAPASVADTRRLGKDGGALIARNMFCADCSPEAAPTGSVDAVDGIPETGLPIELLATSLSSRSAHSFVTVRNAVTLGQGAYGPGDAIPGAGKIERIGGTEVVFHNPNTDRLERATLLAVKRATGTSAKTTRRSPRPSKYADQVKQIDDTTWEVDRDLITQALANPTKLGVKIRPMMKGGELTGFRMFGIRPGTAPYEIGLRNGDQVQSINGHQVSADPGAMLSLYSKLKESSRISVELTRRGKPTTLGYHVR